MVMIPVASAKDRDIKLRLFLLRKIYRAFHYFEERILNATCTWYISLDYIFVHGLVKK